MPKFRVRSNFFGPEMMMLTFLDRMSSVQIPVRYKERVGVSSVTGDFLKAFKLGIQMLILILGMRLGLDAATVRFLEKLG